MSALLIYRSRDCFESRFGRKPQLNQTNKIGGKRALEGAEVAEVHLFIRKYRTLGCCNQLFRGWPNPSTRSSIKENARIFQSLYAKLILAAKRTK